MTMFRKSVMVEDCFLRPLTLTTTPSGGDFGWTVKDTSSSGTPTYTTTADNGLVLTLASTSEAEVVSAYANDVLMFELDQIDRVSMLLKVSGVDSVTTLVAGVATAQNDTADSVATHAWFRMEGSASTSAVVVETDDGTTDDDDNATGATLSSVFKLFEIDFTNGLSDVRFYIDGARVGGSSTFSLANATAGQNVQPFIQLQKASGTGTPAVSCHYFAIQHKMALGA